MYDAAGEADPLQQFLEMHDAPDFHPLCYRPGNLGNWSGHLPFANDLVRALRPRILVELGTHYGESYFGFCQSVAQNGTGSVCYAVDHWHGDEHAGKIRDEVYEEVSAYNNRLYSGFSHLLRCSFDDALPQFDDGSIDLLHIDGLHTYEAAAHDFDSWWPKMAPGGVVLLHDIAVRHVNFGVWKLWDRICREHEETFEFHHSWGLGVVRKPGKPLPEAGLLRTLFGQGANASAVRRYYVLLATNLEYAAERGSSEQNAPRTDAVQIFPFGLQGYSESTSHIEHVQLDRRQVVRAVFTQGLGKGPLRIDICNGKGAVEIWRAAIVDAATGRPMWETEDPAVLASFRCAGQIVALPAAASAMFLSFGSDPQVYIDDLPEAARSAPAAVELSVSVASDPRPFWGTVQAELAALKEAASAGRESARIERDRRVAIENSITWKLAAPVRWIGALLNLGKQ